MSWRPWTGAAARLRHLKGYKRKPPEPITKWKIVRGDLVSFRPYLRIQLWKKFQLKSTCFDHLACRWKFSVEKTGGGRVMLLSWQEN